MDENDDDENDVQAARVQERLRVGPKSNSVELGTVYERKGRHL